MGWVSATPKIWEKTSLRVHKVIKLFHTGD